MFKTKRVSAVVVLGLSSVGALPTLAYEYSWIEGCWESPLLNIQDQWIPVGSRFPVIELRDGLGEVSLSEDQTSSLSYSISPIDEGSFAFYDNTNGGEYDSRFFERDGRLCQIATTSTQVSESEEIEMCYQRCEETPNDE